MEVQPQYAEIIAIGEELLSGDSEIIDTNSIYITKALRDVGIRVLYKTTVGDHEARIIEVVKLALNRVSIILITGGLGPTVDDMTRQGVAGAVGVELELRPELLAELTEKFSRFTMRMSENNRVQAMLPQGATAIDNPTGTAPGFMVNVGDRVIISMPGVPREMKAMMERTVVPYLKTRVQAGGIIKVRVLRTAGLGESLLDERVGEFERLSNPVVGLTAHIGQTDIRISAHGATEAEADTLIADVEARIRERVGSFIYGVDKEELSDVLLSALKARGTKLAIGEQGTDGLLASRLAAYPNISVHAVYGDVNGNSDSKAFAESQAARIRAESGADLAIVVISTQKTALGIASAGETRGRAYAYNAYNSGDNAAHEWAVGWAMSMAWHLLTAFKE
ncbi:MAG TPA: CinA family nicotinamide mononucleotide deamidase-related protein [Aggregatilineales bacterium]|nr:CinA family nicotinamide mononucleotide deamidase-related protein [Aggregatilineales bacterium]